MLNMIDASLRSLLTRGLRDATQVRFGPPQPSWASDPPDPPVISAFLHGIEEDMSGRLADWIPVRDERGRMVGRQAPVRRYRLAYLMTAWAPGEDGEHRLLGAALSVLAQYEAIPQEHLPGPLGELGLAVNLATASPEAPTVGLDSWLSMGVPPRTKLDVVVTAPIVPPLDEELAPPADVFDMGMRNQPPPRPVPREPGQWRDKRIREE